MKGWMERAWVAGFVVCMCWSGRAGAEVIRVGPEDGWEPIEAAGPGDEVVLAPGVYRFRVYLDGQGTRDAPIVIRAEDPGNPPVWDLEGRPVREWPGSYDAGDAGRGAWQITGSYYVISGIVFQNCQDQSSSGIRILRGEHITIRDCVFRDNTNGLIGAGEDVVVEFCEFVGNGKRATEGSMTHNIYIYGGTFTLRYSYLHDSWEGQNFHIRARHAVLEYNWITRPASYLGDMMTCEYLCGGTGDEPIEQVMELRGNVLVQGEPQNMSQILVLFDDEGGSSNDDTGRVESMRLLLVNNTIIGTPREPGRTHRLVNMRNDTVNTYVAFYNNIVVNVAALAGARDPELDNWGIEGRRNWVTEGTETGELAEVLTGTDPGFVDPANLDFRLADGSPCIGQAAQDAPDLPAWEYYRDETVTRMRRPRPTALDLGAFEHGNESEPEGPYGAGPEPGGDAGPGPGPDGGLDGAGTPDAGRDGGTGNDAGSAAGTSDSGCGCRSAAGSASPVLLALVLLVGVRRRRSGRGRPH